MKSVVILYLLYVYYSIFRLFNPVLLVLSLFPMPIRHILAFRSTALGRAIVNLDAKVKQ